MPGPQFCAYLTKVIVFSFQLSQIIYEKMQMQEFYAPGLNFYSNHHLPPPLRHSALDFPCKCLAMV